MLSLLKLVCSRRGVQTFATRNPLGSLAHAEAQSTPNRTRTLRAASCAAVVCLPLNYGFYTRFPRRPLEALFAIAPYAPRARRSLLRRRSVSLSFIAQLDALDA